METKEIYLEDMSKIMDRNYIKDNVGSSYNNAIWTKFYNNKENNWFYWNDIVNKILQLNFDYVTCIGDHSFAGTNFNYNFYKDNNYVAWLDDRGFFGNDIDALKKKIIKKLKKDITFHKRNISETQELIKSISDPNF